MFRQQYLFRGCSVIHGMNLFKLYHSRIKLHTCFQDTCRGWHNFLFYALFEALHMLNFRIVIKNGKYSRRSNLDKFISCEKFSYQLNSTKGFISFQKGFCNMVWPCKFRVKKIFMLRVSLVFHTIVPLIDLNNVTWT